MKKLSALSFLLTIIVISTFSQIVNPVKWSVSAEQSTSSDAYIVFKASIDKSWHMYGINIADGGPIPLNITFEENKAVKIIEPLQQITQPEVVDDPIFSMKVELHSYKAVFRQKIEKLQNNLDIVVKGTINYMTCNDAQCILNDHDFEVVIKSPKENAEKADANQGITDQTERNPDTFKVASFDTIVAVDTVPASTSVFGKSTEKAGLIKTFLLALLAGLGALLTPCVYPMIPMTISYFLRGQKSRGKAIAEALVFGFSIVLIYTLIGVIVALLKNPNAVSTFISHWIPNLLFALIFIALAASFFGMYELVIPGNFVGKIDQQADKGGYIGAFFMALAMVILSFSCTGPIVASLLIAAAQGAVIQPVVGMLGFSVAFALPFTIFAIFPSWLQQLPKSGGWLNTVKVFFAFIMLAFSLYFLSKIDQVYHLNILSRQIFLIIWIVLFILLGLYLLGKIKFAHDSELTHISVFRLILVTAVFSFALYLFTGLIGNNLKSISAIIPPATERTYLSDAQQLTDIENKRPQSLLCSEPKYSNIFELPFGLEGYFDLDEAMSCAHEINKPVLIDFVGHSCSNCKKMYNQVWSDPEVLEILKNNFIIVALYTDDKTKLPENEWIKSSYDGKIKNTIGKKNLDFQITRFNSNALPLYAILDNAGNSLTSVYYTYNPDTKKFISWLEEGIKNYKSND
jgi:thiol:disulfide interchange protein DsbD